MKKFLAMFLAAALLLSMTTACGSDSEIRRDDRENKKSDKSEQAAKETTEETTRETVQYGTSVGDACCGTELSLINGTGFTGETLDPTKTGKITIINFWGTWCTPCVAELPAMDQVASEYSETVAVVAVHSLAGQDSVYAFVAERYAASNIFFVVDSGEGMNGDYYSMLGGNGAYPYTLILDQQGVITYAHVGSLTYDELVSAIAQINR